MESRDSDTKLIVSLLNEYSDKINDVSQALARLRGKFYALVCFCYFGITLSIALPYAYLYSKNTFPLNNNVFMTYLGTLFTLIILFLPVQLMLYTGSFSRLKRDGMKLAYKLERVVKTGSQVQEHVGLSYAEKLEFDLRLAEAEIAISDFTRSARSILF